MSKKLLKFLFYLYLVFAISVFSAWSVWHSMSDGPLLPSSFKQVILSFAEFPSNVYHLLSDPYDRRQIVNTTLVDNPTSYSNQPADNKVSLMMSTFTGDDSIEIKLFNPSDFSIQKRWALSDNQARSYVWESYKNEVVRFVHPMLLKDSSVIFSFFTLFRVGKDNSILWTNNLRRFHHAIEIDEDSTIWTGSRIYGNKYFNYGKDTLVDDAICALDIKTGKIKYEKSVAEILIENNYMPLLQIKEFESDAIHLNDIQPVKTSSAYWTKGDLFVSIRHLNTVFLYRPSINKVLWLKTGPWLAQHDVDVVDDHTIMIFGNDLLRTNKKSFLVNGHNDIYFYDFKKDSVYKPYTDIMKRLNISTHTQGRCDLLPNGDLFVDETDEGELYIIDKKDLKMKYYERFNDQYIKMFTWVRPVFN